jgi:hypothetical protein
MGIIRLGREININAPTITVTKAMATVVFGKAKAFASSRLNGVLFAYFRLATAKFLF